MLVNIVKYRGIDRDKGRERERVWVFNNRKFFSRLQSEKMFEPTSFQVYFFIEYCYLPWIIVVSLFLLWAALIHLNSDVHDVATISAFALFLSHVFIYGWSICCMILYWYYLPLMGKVIQDPGIILVSHIQSATGTWIVCLLTITQSYFS